MLQFLAEFLGHFHPVVVHLPIGVLLLAAIFYAMARTNKYQSLRPAVSLSLFVGVITAVLACITGWLLSTTDQYDPEIVGKHQWLGIATAVVAVVAYAFEKRNSQYISWTIGVLVLMIALTGHLGGSLTHGEDYLTAAFTNYSEADKEIPPIANVQEAMVYQDIIQPILAAKCYSCHSSRKQKGRLRLDGKDHISKGGKSGAAIIPGDANSELVHRIFLPDDNEDHMPPKEKPQLTASQKNIIKWWISSGAPFEKKVRDMDQGSEMKNVLAALSSPEDQSQHSSPLPDVPVEQAPAEILEALYKNGAVIVPVSQNSNYLSANLVNVSAANDSVITMLSSISKQLLWLKTGSYPVDAKSLQTISQLTAIRRLQIGNLENVGAALEHFENLKQLHYLNLSGAGLTNDHVNALKKLTSLKNLYLFNCGVAPEAFAALRKSLPLTNIDTGGYVVPTLPGDTTEVTAGRN